MTGPMLHPKLLGLESSVYVSGVVAHFAVAPNTLRSLIQREGSNERVGLNFSSNLISG